MRRRKQGSENAPASSVCPANKQKLTQRPILLRETGTLRDVGVPTTSKNPHKVRVTPRHETGPAPGGPTGMHIRFGSSRCGHGLLLLLLLGLVHEINGFDSIWILFYFSLVVAGLLVGSRPQVVENVSWQPSTFRLETSFVTKIIGVLFCGG